MSVPASTPTLEGVRQQVSGSLVGVKSFAQTTLAALQAGTVDANFVFNIIDVLNAALSNINAQANALGSANFTALNNYVAAQTPGYAGTYTTDVTTAMNNVSAVISNIVSTFPTDTGGFIQAFKFNSDGSRAPATFTSAQTAGLQSALQTLIASIS